VRENCRRAVIRSRRDEVCKAPATRQQSVAWVVDPISGKATNRDLIGGHCDLSPCSHRTTGFGFTPHEQQVRDALHVYALGLVQSVIGKSISIPITKELVS